MSPPRRRSAQSEHPRHVRWSVSLHARKIDGCPRRQPGWCGLRFRRAAWPCGSVTSWASCSRTCPDGVVSSRWIEDRSQERTAVVRARFPTAACRPCKSREQCTRSNSKGDIGRRITLRPQAEYEAIQQARAQEDTQEWKEQYAHRAGVEGTISQGVRAFGLRRCRYHGLAKTRLQHQLTAAAMHFHRLNAWWTDWRLAVYGGALHAFHHRRSTTPRTRRRLPPTARAASLARRRRPARRVPARDRRSAGMTQAGIDL